MFTPAGLYVFLTYEPEADDGDDPCLAVSVGTRVVAVDASDLRCPACDQTHDVPPKRPAKWIALNKVLNGGRCGACDE